MKQAALGAVLCAGIASPTLAASSFDELVDEGYRVVAFNQFLSGASLALAKGSEYFLCVVDMNPRLKGDDLIHDLILGVVTPCARLTSAIEGSVDARTGVEALAGEILRKLEEIEVMR